MAEKKPIGKITHYFDKIGVAVIELNSALKQGDKIRIEKGNESFEQTVSSMQIEKEKITQGKKGDAVGMKVDQPVKRGMLVFKA